MIKDVKELVIVIAVVGALLLLGGLLILVGLGKVDANTVVPAIISVVLAVFGSAGLTTAAAWGKRQQEKVDMARVAEANKRAEQAQNELEVYKFNTESTARKQT